MMNFSKTLLILLLIGPTTGNLAKASGLETSFSFNKLAQSLCESVKNDQLFQLRYSLRRAKTHIRTIYPQVSCDGQTLLSLATSNQADAVVAYLKLRANPEVISEQSKLASTK